MRVSFSHAYVYHRTGVKCSAQTILTRGDRGLKPGVMVWWHFHGLLFLTIYCSLCWACQSLHANQTTSQLSSGLDSREMHQHAYCKPCCVCLSSSSTLLLTFLSHAQALGWSLSSPLLKVFKNLSKSEAGRRFLNRDREAVEMLVAVARLLACSAGQRKLLKVGSILQTVTVWECNAASYSPVNPDLQTVCSMGPLN